MPDRPKTRFIFAHMGGFIAGLVLVKLFASEDVLQRRPMPPQRW